MLRSTKTFLKKTNIAAGCDLLPFQNVVFAQQARGLRPRKPLFSGIAKSKLFKVPQVPDTPPDEMAEIRRIANQYRLLVRSICKYHQDENKSHAAGSKVADDMIEADEVEWQESLVKIQQWNKDVAAVRDERLLIERKAKEAKVQATILEEEAIRLNRLEEINEIIRKEKELSKTYITPENIDKAIEAALEETKDCNFAIDVRGKKYVGRYVNASGLQDVPLDAKVDDEPIPHLFQSSPIASQSTTGK